MHKHTCIMESADCIWRKHLGEGQPQRSRWNVPPLKSSSVHKQGAADDKCLDPFPAIKHSSLEQHAHFLSLGLSLTLMYWDAPA